VLILVHPGRPVAPHDLWGAWNLHPALLLGLFLAAWAYRRGRIDGRRGRGDVWRARCFAAALVAVGIALVSPLDALSLALASAHMVQHVLLLLVAAPLLAVSAPFPELLRGSPLVLRRATGRLRRSLGLMRGNLRWLRHPTTVWLLSAGAVWFWHAAVPYDAAVDSELLHAFEHASFIATAFLFWRVVIGARVADRVPPGFGVVLVFAMAMQSVFLSALLTFARTPWYARYAVTAPRWGIEPLADQQLAGVIMWIPAGVAYVAAGLTILVVWLRTSEREEVAF
jgi:putative membrane protein